MLILSHIGRLVLGYTGQGRTEVLAAVITPDEATSPAFKDLLGLQYHPVEVIPAGTLPTIKAQKAALESAVASLVGGAGLAEILAETDTIRPREPYRAEPGRFIHLLQPFFPPDAA